MRVLVTGGAGYIGAHVVRLLRRRGDHVVVADDLITGVRARVDGAPLIELDLAGKGASDAITTLILEHRLDSVVHFAARKQVGESVQRPAWYYQQNVGSLANVLMAAESARINRFVFSSSAAVYGANGGLLSEESATDPINPYGQTKLAGEWLVEAASESADFRGTCLRYFNVAGAGWAELGDRAAVNLVPMVFERIDRRQQPVIFGDDYPTADGTCVRDFVHVLDVAEAHLAALDASAKHGHATYNLGTGRGVSVREMIGTILERASSRLVPEVRDRRPGDPAEVVASVAKIDRELGWRARFGLEDIVSSAWESHRALQP